MAHGKKRRARSSRRGRRGTALSLHLTRRAGLRFESLEQRMLLASDFGDAPAPYHTLLTEDGARHEAIGMLLGTLRDTEADGVPSMAADGDGADDDGVDIGSLRVGQASAILTVTVTGTWGGTHYLNGWIDFDSDGAWGGPLEKIVDMQLASTGTYEFTFSVPATAAVGTTYARFRLTTGGPVGPNGVWNNGEVEDYAVAILPPQAAPATFAELPVAHTH